MMRPRLSALDRKLVRDLRAMLGQGVTIALVVAAGIAGFIALQSTWGSLLDSRDAYYAEYRFGDAFASLERAPRAELERLAAIPGVTQVHGRILEPVRLRMGEVVPAPVGQVVSLPSGRDAPLNGVRVREGQRPGTGRGDEALLLAAFADRWGVVPGDTLEVVMDGLLRRVRVTGLASSPEFIYPTPPGGALIPDDERFAVLWMDEEGVAPIYRMEGAFNDVVFRLGPAASLREVLAAIDRVLDPWGGRGAVGRELQGSHFILETELSQLRQYATVVPVIFLGVAAFLLNVVMSRLLKLQRTQVASLKALGYPDRALAAHYLKMASGVVLAGVVLGLVAGAWLGSVFTDFYGSIFGFPVLEFRVGWGAVLGGALVAVAAGVMGAMGALRRILSLSPAEAMAPEPPARYRPLLLERLGLGRLLGPNGRMVLREVGRRPLRLVLSSLGIAMAVAIVVVGRFSGDALETLIDRQFYQAWKENVTVTFTGPVSDRAVREVVALPGVWRAEGMRVTAVRMQSGHRWRDVPLQGYEPGSRLRELVDDAGASHPMPAGGVVLTGKLAEILEVGVGDTVQVRLREGRVATLPLVVTGTVDEMFGLQGHMRIADLNALLGEGPLVSQALLHSDAEGFGELQERLAGLPGVLDVASRDELVARFREQSAQVLLLMTLILTAFAGVIAAGVVYNNARVAVAERTRDLASLRVLGFRRGEISTILLGEMALQVLVAIPPGLLIGHWLCVAIAGTVDPERYRLPVELSTSTYAFAAGVILLAAAVTALLVRRRLDRLDLIGVLKTRE